jgi:cephalosporin hydroxylase
MKYTEITGWMDFEDLYNEAVDNAENGDLLIETGTANGKSAAYLATRAAESGKRLQCVTIGIDPNADPAQCQYVRDVVLPHFPNLTYLHEDSLLAAHRTMFDGNRAALIFLDADHTYQFLSQELRAWYPRLKTGGMFAGHDWDNGYPGVSAAVIEFASANNLQLAVRGNSWQLIP